MTEPTEKPTIVTRLTVALTAKSNRSLLNILRLGSDISNKTDAVNRSLNLYSLLLDKDEQEYDVLLRNRTNGELELVHFV
jgi:hypothetical protein